MRFLSLDTSAEAQQLLIAGWQAMKPTEKAAAVQALCRDCEALASAGIRDRYRGISAREARLRLGALRLGRDLMIQAFGWDPAERGL
jgi:hypothetical protein